MSSIKNLKEELYYWDIFPKVIPVGKEVEITIKPINLHWQIIDEENESDFLVEMLGTEDGEYENYPDRGNNKTVPVKAIGKGAFTIKYTFPKEQEYFLRLKRGSDNWRMVQLSVYAVNEDLVGRYPFVGDLHMHTRCSDGSQMPANVAANYRKHGYDFTVISDHGRYYPSLDAIESYKDLPLDFLIVPGEEVHIPLWGGLKNDIHIVNFGGGYSVNALVQESNHVLNVGDSVERRTYDFPNPPDSVTMEIHRSDILELAKTLDIPEGIEPYTYACCVWVFNHIRAGGGLGIYCHPYWLDNMYQVPETLNDYILTTQPFDAFEVLGGERYYEQNGFQTQKYYEMRARGYDFPIVGSTDSHNSISTSPGAYVASTMVFSPANETKAIIDSVKAKYTVAIDGISEEFRLVGDFRLSKYACFLLKNFFPLHDELCFEEGRAMHDYINDDEDAETIIRLIAPRMKKQREKYFGF